MINGLLPLSSLKRDEIYTFTAGIYIAVIWFLYLGSNSISLSTNSITMYNSCVFIAVWLTSTVLLFVIQLYLSALMRNTLQKYCDNLNRDDLFKILNLGNAKKYYYPPDYYKELLIFIHIIGLSITSCLFIAYPAAIFFDNSLKFMSLYYSILLIIILSLFKQYHNYWLSTCSYLASKRNGLVEVYDEKKYSEEMALCLSKDNIMFNKDIELTNLNNDILNQISITNHVFNFTHDSDQKDDVIEWKWKTTIKVNKTINNSYLRKHAYIEYNLFDVDKFILANDTISFDDISKITIEPLTDNDIPADDSEVVLTCRSVSSLKLIFVKRVSYSSCIIKFT